MHRPRSPRTVRSMMLSSWLFFLLGLNTLLTVPLAICALILVNRNLLLLTLALLGIGLFLLILFRLAAAGARCPLCMGPILLSRHCSRNQHAARALGSYRVRVARDIILTSSFRCPYCGESTHCSPRQRH